MQLSPDIVRVASDSPSCCEARERTRNASTPTPSLAGPAFIRRAARRTLGIENFDLADGFHHLYEPVQLFFLPFVLAGTADQLSLLRPCREWLAGEA